MNAFTIPERMASEAEACGSHIPIFKVLAPVFKPRSVLELGSGLCSTPMFLDREIFPDLEHLTSVENDPAWYISVEKVIARDPRMTFMLMNGAVAPFAAALDIASYDLIFCDDSRSGAERCDTIRSIAPLVSPAAICVIHDYEEQQYQDASMLFDHQYIFDWLNPSTGVCWNGDRDLEPVLESLRNRLRV